MLFPWFLYSQPIHETVWTAIHAFLARNALVFAALSVILASFWQRSPGLLRNVSNGSEVPSALDSVSKPARPKWST